MANNFLHAPVQAYHCSRTAEKLQPGSLNIVGVCFDGTACFRKGASAGPAAIRRVAADIETYSPDLDRDLAEIDVFFDLGDLAVTATGDVEADWQAILAGFADLTGAMGAADRILALGGEHSISYPFIKKYLALFPDLVLLHLDAHADLRDGFQGYHYSHAAVIRRCLDHFGTNQQLGQFGIRSGTKDEFGWMRANHTLHANLPDFLDYLQELPADRPIYLTLDLDFFDPAFLPGTGTPEAGGDNFQSFMAIIKVLKDKHLVGADVVELAPTLDPTGNSEVFATKVVRELILAFHGEDGHVR